MDKDSLDIYVRSRSVPPEKDYCWIGKNKRYFNYKHANKYVDYVNNFIKSENFSVALYSIEKKLLLIITGIISNRKDYCGRKIRNSIAWMVNLEQIEDENIKWFRELAAEFILDSINEAPKLNAYLDEVIFNNPNSDSGFDFDFDKLENLLTSEKQKIKEITEDMFKERKGLFKNKLIGKNTDTNKKVKKELVYDLLYCDNGKFSFLLNNEIPAVIVTGNKNPDSLKISWRSLTKLLEHENWKTVDENLENNNFNVLQKEKSLDKECQKFQNIIEESKKFIENKSLNEAYEILYKAYDELNNTKSNNYIWSKFFSCFKDSNQIKRLKTEICYLLGKILLDKDKSELGKTGEIKCIENAFKFLKEAGELYQDVEILIKQAKKRLESMKN